MPRKQLIAANWKMNKTVKESISFIKKFKNLIKTKNKEIVICPPFTSLHETILLLKNTDIKVAAQNMHHEEQGAYTGEISTTMLKDVGCEYVILGHSERRQYFNETDDLINKKIKLALKNNLKIILCIGETLEQRESDKTTSKIKSQIENCLKSISQNEIKNIVIAYEPIWAIGTGKTATPEQAEEVHRFIRKFLLKNYNQEISENTRIIYGGSVNTNNHKDLLKKENIDGALVGGASLDPENFARICDA